jgi:hypothetical protein
VKTRTALVVHLVLLVFTIPPYARGQAPTIPPSIARISPAGMERGSTVTFTIDGRSLSDASEVIFDTPGLSAKVTTITDIPEKITGPRAGEDLAAQVPLGKKQTAKLEISAAKDALPGIHRFRLRTPLGTSNLVAFAVGTLHEIQRQEQMAPESTAHSQSVEFPATLVGTFATNGEKHSYQFAGKADEETVFIVQASALGSKLASMLTLSDESGQVLATAGQNTNGLDAELHYRIAQAGKYTITISDRNLGNGTDHFYRMDAGELPYVTGVYPLGARTGQATEISVAGLNLGGATSLKVQPTASNDGWTTMPLDAVGDKLRPVNEVRIAVGSEPEIAEQEPNDNLAHAQTISLPVAINGRIDSGNQHGDSPDQDYFRFHANKGQKLSIDIAAARLGSPFDSVIEILDAHGNAIPRATIRCLHETTTTLADRDSRTSGIRLLSTSGLREGDYIMVGDELDQIDFIPDQPDADTILKAMGDLRAAFLGTSPDVHAVNTPVYKTQILAPDADVPSNGLPVYRLAWRNDDGGPGYGADSKLDFVAPADGDYYLHLKDVRNLDGSDFAYRLTVRDQILDFKLRAEPANPNIPRGGTIPVTVSLDEIRGFDGPIEIAVKGLPRSVTAGHATIPAGQTSTVLVLTAAPDAALDAHPAPIQIVGRAVVDGHDLIRIANRETDRDEPLQLASIVPPPDVVVSSESNEVTLDPGKEITVRLNVERHNGFKGRVPCTVQNLPFGVRVVNVGLNGVLVTEAQSSRTFTLRAEDWAKPVSQPIYIIGEVESNSSTMHPSAPLMLRVTGNTQTASADSDQKGRQ